MKKSNNPFVLYGYKGAEYFCDRKEETLRLMNCLRQEQNATLIAPRRMGKTGLIHHVFNKIQTEEPEVRCFYMDIFPTHSLEEFVRLFAQTVIGRLDTPSQAAFRNIQAFFSSWRPKISIDPVSGLPSVSLDIRPSEERESLRQIFEYMKQSGRRCYVAIDEFQQILNYPQDGVEALLRSYVQFLPNVYFIFSGSQQHVMEQMFLAPSRPFFQSTMLMSLFGIDRDEYRSFANGFFSNQGRQMDTDCFSYIYDLAGGITWYVQAIMHKIYFYSDIDLNKNTVDMVLDEILNEQSVSYQNFCAWLTGNQYYLLRAIASEGCVATPLSRKFISDHGLPAISSVKTALKSLEEKQLVQRGLQGYSVSDIFFGLWLRRNCRA